MVHTFCLFTFPVYKVFENVAQKYDVMNDAMSLGVHRLWKDALLHVMHPQPGTRLLDVAGGTGRDVCRHVASCAPCCSNVRNASYQESTTTASTRRTSVQVTFPFVSWSTFAHRSGDRSGVPCRPCRRLRGRTFPVTCPGRVRRRSPGPWCVTSTKRC